jgi:ATP-dependent protease ClpP protease subunit
VSTTNDLRTLLREGFDSPEKWYALNTTQERGKATAELLIYDVIGWWPNDADTLARTLKDLDADEIKVRINSPGGSVFDGFALYNALRSHSATVTTVVEGLAASAASIIALAGDRVVMRPASELMIHEAWTFADGSAADMRKVADMLDSINNTVAGIYASKAGTPDDMWREAMRVETWFTPGEALEAGLVDAVEDGRVRTDVSNRAMLPIFNYAGRAAAPAPHLKASSAQAEGNRKEGTVPTIQDQLRLLVGVTDDEADDEAIVAAVEEALNEQAADDDTAVTLTAEQFTALAEAVDMTADDDPGAVVDEVIARLAAADDDGDGDGASNKADPDIVAVDANRFSELVSAEAALASYREKDAQAEAERLVDEAITDGRLAAASKDRWVSKLLDDPEDAKPRLANIKPARIPRSEVGRGETAGDFDNPDAAEREQLTQKARAAGFGRQRLV